MFDIVGGQTDINKSVMFTSCYLYKSVTETCDLNKDCEKVKIIHNELCLYLHWIYLNGFNATSVLT